MKKLISNQISPNLKFSDFLIGFKALFEKSKKLDFSRFFGSNNYFLCNSARVGLLKIIEILDFPDNQKVVAIPAFCCGVMATPFLANNFKIIWIDTDKNGNISYKDFIQKFNKYLKLKHKISILLIPPIFGQALNLAKFYEFCQQNNIFCIFDEAHNFVPANILKNSKINKAENLKIKNNVDFFDAKILSFGREKTFSCVSGGAVIWSKKSKFSRDFENVNLKKSSKLWIFRHLFQIFIYSIALPFWFYGGKILPFLALKLKLLPLAVTPLEKNGKEDFPKAELPYCLQKIIYNQLDNAKQIQQHRKNIAEFWKKIITKNFPELVIIIPENYFRVILKFNNNLDREIFLKKSKKLGFYFREWDGVPISPVGVDFKAFKYTNRSCQDAEEFAGKYLTLPTNIRISQNDIKNFIMQYKKS
jgi:dTDP-4-amino-4,6-dideoxygalactose transaminase